MKTNTILRIDCKALANGMATRPTNKAKNSECVKPRCPKSLEEAMPNRNAKTSKSGKIVAAIPKISSRLGITVLPNAKAKARGTTGCERIVGMVLSTNNRLFAIKIIAN